ncbi:WXG100 family type VII secretion target [Mycobacterium lentiflavum]|uniref:WXG100 family type VII secretion target n=1 Tax=Mycobacterium lentiflavum TaxID=141349 RepID=A0ABY3V3N5_MYCLN|nr:WXG100 family type VII secretion target [Mycobacterium lentiflavum]ULP44263.1 WXG100 family type VII secretion target [Mycobacterium lentiflavum]
MQTCDCCLVNREGDPTVCDINIDVDQLTVSGRQVSDQAEELAAGLLTADNRIEAAQDGWAGTSAVALSARAARWLPVAQALVRKVGEHGFALQDAAVAHAAAEAERARALAGVAARAAAVGGRG